MKKYILFVIIISLSIFSANAGNPKPVGTFFTSSEIDTITGASSISIFYAFSDSLISISEPTYTGPNSWNYSTSPSLNGNSFFANDTVSVSFLINYPVISLPFYAQKIIIEDKFVTKRSIEIGTPDTMIIHTIVMIYFTPYSTIEIWNLQDFYDLPRMWINEEENPNAQRIIINKADLPVSNININNPIDWFGSDSIWDNDCLDNYREIVVPGLGYKVLMEPVPEDSIEYYRSYGDGPDSVSVDTSQNKSSCAGKWFRGSVTGYFKARISNDHNSPETLPLGGIRVVLKERDALFSDIIATGYTEDDGRFYLEYETCQIWEGDYVELFLKFISTTDDEFKIASSNFFGFRHTYYADVGSVGQDAYGQDVGTQLLVLNQYTDPINEAFTTVHWVRNGYMFFKENNILLDPNIRININCATGSWFCRPENLVNFGQATINIGPNDGDREGTTYHELGHFIMYRLQNNTFTSPYGEDGFNHSWSYENTSRLAWSEGWADAMQMILDARYYLEDNEYATERENNSLKTYEELFTYDDINNGFRSEYNIACAIYDLWDGANKNLPELMPGYQGALHGYNDTYWNYNHGQWETDWALADNVELSLNFICQPLIDHPSGSDKILNIQTYYHYLLSQTLDCQTHAAVSRVFKENHVLWDIGDYKHKYSISNLSSDVISLLEYRPENPSTVLISDYIDEYWVNYYNKLLTNEFHLPATFPNMSITDDLWLGVRDYASPVNDRQASLFLNDQTLGNNLAHCDYFACTPVHINVENGQLYLGDNGLNSSNLSIENLAVLEVKENGLLTINNGASVIIEDGGSLLLQWGASVQFNGNGMIVIKDGGFLCIEKNTNISDISRIFLENGYEIGINPLRNIPHEHICGYIGCGTIIEFDFPEGLLVTPQTAAIYSSDGVCKFKEDLIIIHGVLNNTA